MRSLILYRVNGQAEQLADWNQVNWVTVNKLIRNLQRRIFRERLLGQWKQLRRLQKLLYGENIETHHIVLVKDGGSDDAENLIHLHIACHKQEHSKPK